MYGLSSRSLRTARSRTEDPKIISLTSPPFNSAAFFLHPRHGYRSHCAFRNFRVRAPAPGAGAAVSEPGRDRHRLGLQGRHYPARGAGRAFAVGPGSSGAVGSEGAIRGSPHRSALAVDGGDREESRVVRARGKLAHAGTDTSVEGACRVGTLLVRAAGPDSCADVSPIATPRSACRLTSPLGLRPPSLASGHGCDRPRARARHCAMPLGAFAGLTATIACTWRLVLKETVRCRSTSRNLPKSALIPRWA